jgi:hypothetical protein
MKHVTNHKKLIQMQSTLQDASLAEVHLWVSATQEHSMHKIVTNTSDLQVKIVEKDLTS